MNKDKEWSTLLDEIHRLEQVNHALVKNLEFYADLENYSEWSYGRSPKEPAVLIDKGLNARDVLKRYNLSDEVT